MSTEIDHKVVEMRFDNKQFENNVQTSMSTIDKLKQKLNLTGASKGLENLGAAAKSVSFAGLNSGIETVQAKFSAMQVVGITALSNITNQAINAGKRMLSALTIDPVSSGFKEYETQIGSIQTILSNTRQEGTNVEIVNKALDELNTYADKTIYNFTEMTRNIGTFTAAGVKLDTSVSAIKGIANLAAVSGSTSQQASTAMYQLSQALAAGKVQLMDWNSVVNAGMGGKVFQDALLRTSERLKTGGKAAVKQYGSFRESLTKGEWLTTDVLTETLKQLSGAYTEADLISQGYTKAQAKEIKALADDAISAAQDVKTFTQLWDTLKEAAQSGWAQSWRIIVGDFDQAKKIFTQLSKFIGGVIDKTSEIRNKILDLALNVISPITKVSSAIDRVSASTKKVTEATQDYSKIVDRIIKGEFGNGEARWNKLTEMGYDWAHAQNLVNERLGDSTRHATKYKEAQDGVNKTQAKTIEEYLKLSDAQLKQIGFTQDEIEELRNLEKQANAAGYSLEEVLANPSLLSGRNLIISSFKNAGQGLVEVCKSIAKAWREVFYGNASEDEILQKRAERIYDIIAAINRFSAHLRVNDETAQKITRTFKGLFALIDIITTIMGGGFKLAFKVVSKILGAFHIDILDLTAGLGDMIVKFRDFLLDNKLVNKGLELLASGIVKMVKKIKSLFNAFKNLPVVQAGVKRLSQGFERLKNIDFTKAGGKIVDYLSKIGDGFKRLFNTFKDLPIVKAGLKQLSKGFEQLKNIDLKQAGKVIVDYLLKMANGVKALVDSFANIPIIRAGIDRMVDGFDRLKEVNLLEVGKNIIDGLKNGIKNGISSLPGVLIETGKTIIDTIKNILGIHSPSTVMIAIGGFIIAGLLLGIQNGFPEIGEAIKKLGTHVGDAFAAVPWDKIFAGGIAVAILLVAKQISDVTAAFRGFGDFMEKFGGVLKSLSKSITRVGKAISMDLKASALQKLAISLAILVAAIWVLTTIKDIKKLWNAVGVIMALSVILVGLSIAVDKMSASSVSIGKGGAKLEGLKSGLLQIGLALLMLAAVVKIIGSMDPAQAKKGFIALAAMAGGMLLFVIALAVLGKNDSYKSVDNVGKTMVKLATAMLLMIVVCKLVAKLEYSEMGKGLLFAFGFAAFVAAIAFVTKVSSDEEIASVGGLVIKLTIAMALMVGVVKLVSKLSEDEMWAGVAFATGFVVFVAAIVLISKLFPQAQIQKIGGLILSISFSLLLMVGICKIVALLSPGEMIVGGIFVAAFIALIGLLVKMTTVGSSDQVADVAKIVLAVAASLAILAGVAVLIGLIDPAILAQGVITIGLFGGVIAGLVAVTKKGKDVKGTLIAVTAAIAVMAASIAILGAMDPKKVLAAAGSMALVMGMFAVIAASTSRIKEADKTLVIMALVIGIMGIALSKIAKLPISNTLGAAGALSILIGAMIGALFLLSKMDDILKKATEGIVGLTLMAVPLLAFVLVLNLMKGVNNAIASVIALTVLTVAMTAMLALLSAIGNLVGSALAGILALTLMAVPLLAFVGVLYLMKGITNARENATLLTELMIVMAAVLVAISLVGPLAGPGIVALTALGAVMVAFGALAMGIGALMEKFPQLESFLDTGIPIMEKLAHGIGSMIGNFIAGFSEAIFATLPKLGEALSQFMEKLQPFVEKIKMVDGSVVEGVAYITAAILALSVANVISGISRILSLGQSFSDLGIQLAAFGDNILPFLKMMKAIGPDTLEAASSLSGLILALTASELLNGIASFFGIEMDFGEFGNKIAAFGASMKQFDEALGEDGINTEAVKSAAEAGKLMTEVANAIPKKEGFLQDIVGTSDLADFGETCKAFGASIKVMSDSLTGENGASALNKEAIQDAADAGTAMSDLANAIPKKDGLLQDFAGTQDLANFGVTCEEFAKSVKKMSDSLTGENGISSLNMEALKNAAAAGTAMTDVANAIPKSDGLAQKFAGTKDLASFGTKCEEFADAIVAMSDALSNDDGSLSINTEAIDAAVTAGSKMTEVANAIPADKIFDGKVPLDKFGEKLALFGGSVSEFDASVKGISTTTLNAAVEAAKKLTDVAETAAGIDVDNIDNFGCVVDIGSYLSDYYSKINGIDGSTIKDSATAANTLRGVVYSLSNIDPDVTKNFIISPIGAELYKYWTHIKDINAGQVTGSTNSAEAVRAFLHGLSSLNTSGVEPYVSAIDKLSTTSLDKLVKNFNVNAGSLNKSGVKVIDSIVGGMKSKEVNLTKSGGNFIDAIVKGFKSKEWGMSISVKATLGLVANKLGRENRDSFSSAGKRLISNLASGVREKGSDVKTTSTDVTKKAISAINSYYLKFRDAGEHLGDGLIIGIKGRKDDVYEVAYELGQEAVEGEKKGQDSNSPSKATIKAGKWLGEGLIVGIKKIGSQVYDAGKNLGSTTTRSLSSSISNVADLINTGIDPNPAIRPVMDLSNIKSGVSDMNHMLSRNASVNVGAYSNIAAVNTLMNQSGQNGSNADVVNAINKLRKDLSNVGNTTYNTVNGLTYDDGQNISDAVRAITRAVRMERRS